MAKTIASLAIVRTMSVVSTPGPETPMKTSAPVSASASVPCSPRGLVLFAMSAWAGFIQSSPGASRPRLSLITMSRAPSASSRRAIEMPAAPAPEKTMRTSSSRLPTRRRALVRPAATMIAVPCWSSWKTGMSSSRRRRLSISKQRGAEMSSRLMPPKLGAMRLTVSTISSGSLVSRQIGKASMPANSLKRMALPSITGMPASGPMSPRPSTAVPSVTTATRLPLSV